MKQGSFKIFFLCLVLVYSSTALNAQVQSKTYNFMLKKLLSQTVPYISCDSLANAKNVVLLDTRETVEYEVSHINNSIYLGYEDIDSSAIDGISKDDTIVVYCSVGYRSEKVGEWLISQGFKHVFNLHGGIFEWKNQENEVVDMTNTTTEKVHAYNKTWGMWLKKGQKVY